MSSTCWNWRSESARSGGGSGSRPAAGVAVAAGEDLANFDVKRLPVKVDDK